MIRLGLSVTAMCLGAALIFLAEDTASLADRWGHPHAAALTKIAGLLESGDPAGYEAALKDFVLADRGTPDTRAIALYNLGALSIFQALQGDRAAARDSFFYFRESLRNDPHLLPAKHNLELLVRMKNQSQEEKDRSAREGPWNDLEGEERQRLKKGLTPKPPYLGSRP